MITRIILTALILSISTFSQAQDYKGGATIVPIADGLPNSQFNLKTDAASIYLEKAILHRDNGWFTKDKEVAVTAKITINSQKKDRTNSSLTITRVYKFDISIYDDGKIEIPLRSLPLLDTFRLSAEEKYIVTSIIVNLFLSKKKEKSGFSKTLLTIIDVSKKIPIPGNPYIEYANVFGDAFSSVIDEAIKEGADTVPFATFGLRFLQGEKASNYTERSGVHAIVIGPGEKKEGLLDLESMDRKKLTYDDVSGLLYESDKVLNNYLIVRVISSTDPWLALAAKEITLLKMTKEVPVAVNFAKVNNFKTPNLDEFAAALKLNPGTFPANFDEFKFEASIKELNAVKAVNPLDKGIVMPLNK